LLSVSRSRRNFLEFALAGAAIGLVFASPALTPRAEAASAPKGIPAELLVILATQSDAGGIAPELAGIAELKAGQLGFFHSFQLIKKETFTLEVGGSHSNSVPDGGPTLDVTLASAGKDEHGHMHYTLAAGLTSNSTTSTFNIVSGPKQRVIIGGPSYKAGTLFFSLRLAP
jgi:hypothetical protein